MLLGRIFGERKIPSHSPMIFFVVVLIMKKEEEKKRKYIYVYIYIKKKLQGSHVDDRPSM